ncbi:MAG: hypothetical protein ABIG61_16315, partial [Planctomycetota bacterium]
MLELYKKVKLVCTEDEMSGRKELNTLLMMVCLVFLCSSVSIYAGDPNEWRGNTIGLPMRVLKPWTPLSCGTKSVSAWGRTFTWDQDLLPG